MFTGGTWSYYISNNVCFPHSICREDSADQSQSTNSQVQGERQVGAKEPTMLVLFCLFWFFTGQKEAFMWLLPFLLFSVIWSLISMSTTQWASETHSFWEVMPMVSADNTWIWEAVDQLTGPFTNQSSHKQCTCYLNKDWESFSFFTCCAYVLFFQLISG